MTRAEFMERLKELLSDISEEERQEAVSYYEAYFDDAGPQMERKIIEELGSPEQTAAEIKAGLGRQEPVRPEEERQTEKEESRAGASGGVVLEKKRWSIGFIILLCFLAVPLGIPLLAVVFSVFVTVIAVLFTIIVAAFGVGAGLFIGGVVTALYSLIGFTVSPGAAFLICGGGLVMFGIGIAFLWGGVYVCRAIPACFRFFTRPFRRGKRRGGEAL